MPWARLNGMPEQPQCCVACGGNPADFEGNQRQALWAEGVDIDWGNMLYLCWDCGEIIADLVGRATRGGFDDLTKKYETLRETHAQLLLEHEELKETVDKILNGAAARRRLKEVANG
jgi:hypothetical protein